jgi:hypothetical protein
MTEAELVTADVDTLWHALVAAKKGGDQVTVRRIENRMRQLQDSTRFASLTDAELDAKLLSLAGNREPKNVLAYSPGGVGGGDAGIADTMAMNRKILDQQHVGVEGLRAQLLAEKARRAIA